MKKSSALTWVALGVAALVLYELFTSKSSSAASTSTSSAAGAATGTHTCKCTGATSVPCVPIYSCCPGSCVGYA